MPSFPPPGSVTLCEINRDLLTADSLSDAQAKATYGKILGRVFCPIPFQSDQKPEDTGADIARNDDRKGIRMVMDFVSRIFLPNDVNYLPEVAFQGVSWHHQKHIIAFISGPGHVTVHDYEDAEIKDQCILASEPQIDVRAIEWRPNGGRSLAVGCKGGICIWAASYPGNMVSVRSGNASFLATFSRESETNWVLVDFLRSHNGEQVTAISWRPDGRYLAAGSFESSSFTIWDVAQGHGTPIRRGLGGISLLQWSPSGDYFFASKFDGTFYLWETNTWTFEPWSSTSGFVTGVAWDPDGRKVLVAFSGSSTLGSIHFASRPPSLDAQFVPLQLQEMSTLTGSQGIEKIALDASGERLAVSHRGGEDDYKGLIAIYDIRRVPLISASLVGFIRGPGDNPKPIAFSFHDSFKQGPLLSVCWNSGYCCTYPLLFRSQVLP